MYATLEMCFTISVISDHVFENMFYNFRILIFIPSYNSLIAVYNDVHAFETEVYTHKHMYISTSHSIHISTGYS